MQDISFEEGIPITQELVPYDIEEYRLQNSDIVDVTMKTTSAELNEMLKGSEVQNQIKNMDGLNSGDVFLTKGNHCLSTTPPI